MTLLLVACAVPLRGQTATPPLQVPYTQFRLANGLTVILHQDKSVPIVTVNVWYHVGSANEKPGRTGFAHSVRAPDVRGIEERQGRRVRHAARERRRQQQRSTTNDRPTTSIDVPSNALELALFSSPIAWRICSTR
jgi:predicted Zn-dependent peptidase